jgi:hypothetical protein
MTSKGDFQLNDAHAAAAAHNVLLFLLLRQSRANSRCSC